MSNYQTQPSPSKSDRCSDIEFGDYHEREDLDVDNLDLFFARLYEYYEDGGFSCIVVGRLLKIVEAAFLITFSTFLVFRVNWKDLVECHHEECEKVNWMKLHLGSVSPWQALFIVVDTGFALYFVLLVWEFLVKCRTAWDSRNFYHKYLGIDDVNLQTAQWGDICAKIVDAVNRYNISRVGAVDQLTITMRIMRKENYLIAMVNKEVLGPNITLTKSLEWNLKWVISCMLDQGVHNHSEEDFDRNVDLVKRELRRICFVNIIVSPFILCYLIIDTIFTYVAQLRENPGKLVMRRWTCMALWKFREFNEVPHSFERRIHQSDTTAANYLKQFPHRLHNIVAKTVIFVLGGFAAVIILLSIRNDSLLNSLDLFGQNLLWWLGILTLCIFGVMQYTTSDNQQSFEPNAAMADLVKHTHYHPSKWRNNAHVLEVRDELKNLFQLRWWIFLQEFGSILITPFHLGSTLSNRAEDIVQFMKDFTVDAPSTGYVCALSTFNFERFGSLPRTMGASSTSSLNPRNPNHSHRGTERLMEKGFLSFRAIHPSWVPPPESQPIVDWIAKKSKQQQQKPQLTPRTATGFGESIPATSLYASTTSSVAAVGEGSTSNLLEHPTFGDGPEV